MKKALFMALLLLSLIILAGCSKNHIIDPIREYEEYLLEGAGNGIYIHHAELDEEKRILVLIMEINDYTPEKAMENIMPMIEKSDAFFDENPDYLICNGYRVDLCFRTQTDSNGDGGYPICYFSNSTEHGINTHMIAIKKCNKDMVTKVIDHFDYMEEINCFSFNDEQVKQVCETWVNLKTVVIDTQTRADSFSEAYPKIEFLAVRDDE